MDIQDAAEDRTQEDGRNGFEKFVEAVQGRVSRAPFFLFILVIVLAWLFSAPLWPDLKQWQVAIHTFASVVSILLLVLLENAGRRAEEASQEKLNVLAEALAELMESHSRTDPELEDATRKLREAVGLEERH
ncbi:MAG: low affinity iron permease family protein [Marmoricola sp.]